MRRDHRPYWLRRVMAAHEAWHARHFLHPTFDSIGAGCSIAKPWHVHVFGSGIHLGSYVEIRATAANDVRFTSWTSQTGTGHIRIGDCCLIGPGVRLHSAQAIELQDAVMLASEVLISDADWHDHYDRLSVPGRTERVVIEENAWLGDRVTVLKGSRIGCNTIIGAGSVVAGTLPANVIAAGNPARVIRELDPDRPLVTRRVLYNNPEALAQKTDALYRLVLKDNTTWGWLRASLFPSRRD